MGFSRRVLEVQRKDISRFSSSDIAPELQRRYVKGISRTQYYDTRLSVPSGLYCKFTPYPKLGAHEHMSRGGEGGMGGGGGALFEGVACSTQIGNGAALAFLGRPQRL